MKPSKKSDDQLRKGKGRGNKNETCKLPIAKQFDIGNINMRLYSLRKIQKNASVTEKQIKSLTILIYLY